MVALMFLLRPLSQRTSTTMSTDRVFILSFMHPFLTQLFKNLASINVDLSGLVIDHIAYRAATPDEGDTLRAQWDATYSLLKSAQINGREVRVYQCEPPIQYEQWSIPGLELLYPKPSKPF